MSKHEIQQPENKYIAGCVICGQQKPVMMYPHRLNDLIVGWVFVCADHEKDVQGLYCEFKKEISPTRNKPIQLAEASPDA